jgi:hypothetical protein
MSGCEARRGLAQLGYDLTVIGHEDLFAVPHEAQVLAQPVLQLADPNSAHAGIVATRRHGLNGPYDAQRGDHIDGIHEVTGSIPVSSTNSSNSLQRW